MCVYGSVLRLCCRLNSVTLRASCSTGCDTAGISIHACQTHCFCGRVSGLKVSCSLKLETSQLKPEGCLYVSAGGDFLLPLSAQWLEGVWLEWRQEVEAQVDASILLGHIASNAPGLTCFSLFSEPAEPHGGQTGTWA